MQDTRTLSPTLQMATLLGTELRRLSTARKTIVLVVIQLLPVLAALVYVIFKDVDGLTMFRNVIEYVTMPYLLPLAALFYGGPAIVDEMEGRTLTYLTLRPVPKPVLFIGKLIGAMIMAVGVVVIPILLLFLVCLGQSSDLSSTVESLGYITLAAALGAVTYTAIFALLGALFASTLLAGIIYFVVAEMVLAALPVLELLSIKYYLRTAAGFQSTDRIGMLDRLVLEEPLVFDWWVGVVVVVLATLVASVLGAITFRERQYHV